MTSIQGVVLGALLSALVLGPSAVAWITRDPEIKNWQPVVVVTPTPGRDQTADIQAAIDAAGKIGSAWKAAGIVYFSPGTYSTECGVRLHK